jgi:catechol 2,3-dioxygenase-like lactoylglutathione lyase family enzyme
MNAIARMPIPAKQRGKVAPAKLAHVVLRTTPDRVDLVAGWYKTVLEGEPMFENEQLAFITYDSEHHRVAILGMPGVKPHVDGHAGLHHMAFTYANLGDLVHTYERLKDAGIAPQFCINHGPTTSMYFFDPDKNQVELQVDNVAEAKFGEYFASGEFAKNPIGIKFDPDELARRYHAGEPEAQLLTRPEGAPPDLSEFPVN